VADQGVDGPGDEPVEVLLEGGKPGVGVGDDQVVAQD